MSQLDALRAFAVLSVLFAHFILGAPPRLATFLAGCGVQLFFVLSGFLITGILLDCRKEVEAGTSRFWMLRQFYVRRFLRIFPLYYLVVIVAWIINLPGFTDTLGWNLAYLTNFYIVRNSRWIESASHLWTLSVEEQFYFVWPWIVLFLPNRWLMRTFIAVGIFAVVYRVVFISWFGPWLSVTPFASFDCFALGGLLAIAQRREVAGDQRLRRVLCSVGFWVGLPLLVLGLAWHFPPRSIAGSLGIVNLAAPLLFTPLIARAAEGFSGVVGTVLTQRPLLYIGKISYGIYVYHLPVRWLVNVKGASWLNHLPLFIPKSALLLAVTIGVAALSWHLFERPINQLKRHFPYRATRPTCGLEERLIEASV